MQFIQRKIYLKLQGHLQQPEISLILGPRQAGKTTVMRKLADELKQQGKKTILFNLDVIEDRQYFISQHALVDRINKQVGSEAVVFLDEIQRLENAGLFLKGLWDLQTGYKFVVSGSGSLELKANIVEPMTGRKQTFYCLPLSFTEFAAYRLGVDFASVSSTLSSNPYEAERVMQEYVRFGGYPRVVLAQTESEKREVLSEIYRSYLEKDIQLLLGVEKEDAFQMLVKILARQAGNIVNRAELAATIGINEKTVEKYMTLLEKTFVVVFVHPFVGNIRSELRKSPKVYFFDLGFLTLAQGQREGLEGGSVFENACYLRLLELDLPSPVRFWRTATGGEVDFILTDASGAIVPVEVKYSLGKREVIGKSLASFIKKYAVKTAYLYTRSEAAVTSRFGASIRRIPYIALPQLEGGASTYSK